jgi:hypothetical protein
MWMALLAAAAAAKVALEVEASIQSTVRTYQNIRMHLESEALPILPPLELFQVASAECRPLSTAQPPVAQALHASSTPSARCAA